MKCDVVVGGRAKSGSCRTRKFVEFELGAIFPIAITGPSYFSFLPHPPPPPTPPPTPHTAERRAHIYRAKKLFEDGGASREVY